MADLLITGDRAERIRKAAEAAKLDVEAFLDSMFPPDEPDSNHPIPGTLSAMAESAERANLRFGTQDDIA